MLVVLYHAGVPGVTGGFVGVDVFFVISGYLITRLLVTECLTSGRISLSNFYLRRVRRLLPALALVTSTTMIAAWALLPKLSSSDTATDGLWASVYLANFRFISVQVDYLSAGRALSPLLHLWSLAVEEQFYLVWPLLLIVITWRLKNRRAMHGIAVMLIALASCSLIASVVLTSTQPVVAYYSPLTRAWELSIGGLAAVFAPALLRLPLLMRSAMSWAGLAMIVIASTTYTVHTPFPGYLALMPVLGAAGVIAGTRRGGLLEKLLSRRPFQHIGATSYSLYLWHWPMLALAALVAGHRPPLLINLLLVAVAMLAATATYRFVENPVRRSTRLNRRRRNGLALALILTLGTAGLAYGFSRVGNISGSGRSAHAGSLAVGAQSSRTKAQRLLEQTLRQASATKAVPRNLTPSLGTARQDLDAVIHDGCHLGMYSNKTSSGVCTYANTSSSSTIIIFGDSHAAHWFPAMEKIAVRRDLRLVDLTRSSCPSIYVAAFLRYHAPYPACPVWREDSLRRIGRERPKLVVVSNSWGYCRPTVEPCADGLSRLIRAIATRSPATRVVVLEDVPWNQQDVPDCLSAHLDDARACAGHAGETLHPKVSAALSLSARGSNATFVRTSRWFCVDKLCPVVVGNMLVYRDSNHVTVEFSTWLTPVLDAEIGHALQQ